VREHEAALLFETPRRRVICKPPGKAAWR
jgi:hypothetical protein